MTYESVANALAVHGVTVKRSVYALGATATIKVPVTAVLRQADLPATRVETAQAVAVGDRVEIRLGYDGRNRLEFRGYVKALNLRTPLEIVCEDEFWQCRRRNITASGTTTPRRTAQKKSAVLRSDMPKR